MGTPVSDSAGAVSEHFDADQARRLVEFSIRKYRRAHRRYEENHPEIFNPIEQGRLHAELERAVGELRCAAGRRPLALDLGCGNGNVTRHLVELGLEVVAADVSPDFLRQIEMGFRDAPVRTLRIDGVDLHEVADRSVDMVCAYSVLHHVPNYLTMVAEVCRILRPGGILFIDHEANDNFYDKSSCFWDLMREVQQHRIDHAGWWNPEGRRWQRYLMPSKYAGRIRRLFDPGYPWNVEGDIHTWELRRIEWDRIEALLAAHECEMVRRNDYLVYSAEYPDEIWERFHGRCTNMRLLVGRREG